MRSHSGKCRKGPKTGAIISPKLYLGRFTPKIMRFKTLFVLFLLLPVVFSNCPEFSQVTSNPCAIYNEGDACGGSSTISLYNEIGNRPRSMGAYCATEDGEYDGSCPVTMSTGDQYNLVWDFHRDCTGINLPIAGCSEYTLTWDYSLTGVDCNLAISQASIINVWDGEVIENCDCTHNVAVTGYQEDVCKEGQYCVGVSPSVNDQGACPLPVYGPSYPGFPAESYRWAHYNKAACACALGLADVPYCNPSIGVTGNCWSQYAHSIEDYGSGGYGCCASKNSPVYTGYWDDGVGSCSSEGYSWNDFDTVEILCTAAGHNWYSSGSGSKRCCGDDGGYLDTWCADTWMCYEGQRYNDGFIQGCDDPNDPYNCYCVSCDDRFNSQSIFRESVSYAFSGIVSHDNKALYYLPDDPDTLLRDVKQDEAWALSSYRNLCYSGGRDDVTIACTLDGWDVSGGRLCPRPGYTSDGTKVTNDGDVCHYYPADYDWTRLGDCDDYSCKIRGELYDGSCCGPGEVCEEYGTTKCFTKAQSRYCDSRTGWECRWGSGWTPRFPEVYYGKCRAGIDITQGASDECLANYGVTSANRDCVESCGIPVGADCLLGCGFSSTNIEYRASLITQCYDGCVETGWVYVEYGESEMPTDCSYPRTFTRPVYDDGNVVYDENGDLVTHEVHIKSYDCKSNICSEAGWICCKDEFLNPETGVCEDPNPSSHAWNCEYCDDCDQNMVCDNCEEYDDVSNCPDMNLASENENSDCHCADGVDNDGDGAVDCCDMDCQNAEACEMEASMFPDAYEDNCYGWANAMSREFYEVYRKYYPSYTYCYEHEENFVPKCDPEESWPAKSLQPGWMETEEECNAWLSQLKSRCKLTEWHQDHVLPRCENLSPEWIDLDENGILDSCEEDRDKDGCPNEVDYDPDSACPIGRCLNGATKCSEPADIPEYSTIDRETYCAGLEGDSCDEKMGCSWDGCVAHPCREYGSESVCKEHVGCSWDRSAEQCGPLSCSTYDGNKNSCLSDQVGCEWTGRCISTSCYDYRFNRDQCNAVVGCEWDTSRYIRCQYVSCLSSDKESCEANPGCFWSDRWEYCDRKTCSQFTDSELCNSHIYCAWDTESDVCGYRDCRLYGSDEDACNAAVSCRWDGKCVSPDCLSIEDSTSCESKSRCEWVGDCKFSICEPIQKCEGTEPEFCTNNPETGRGSCENLCADGKNNDNDFLTVGKVNYNLGDSCDLNCNPVDQDGDGVPNACDYDDNADGCLDGYTGDDGTGAEASCNSACSQCINGVCTFRVSTDTSELKSEGQRCMRCDGSSDVPKTVTAESGVNCEGDCEACDNGVCIAMDVCEEAGQKCNQGNAFFQGTGKLCDSQRGSCQTADGSRSVCETCAQGVWSSTYRGNNEKAPCCGDDGNEDSFLAPEFVCVRGEACGDEPGEVFVDNGDGVFDPATDECGCTPSQHLKSCSFTDGSNDWDGLCVGSTCCDDVVVDVAGEFECMAQGTMEDSQEGSRCDDVSDGEFSDSLVKGGQTDDSLGCCPADGCWEENTKECVNSGYSAGNYLCHEGDWNTCGSDTPMCQKLGKNYCSSNGWSTSPIVCGTRCDGGRCSDKDGDGTFTCESMDFDGRNRPTETFCIEGGECCSGNCINNLCSATGSCDSKTVGVKCAIGDRSGKCAIAEDMEQEYVCCDPGKGEYLIDGTICATTLKESHVELSCDRQMGNKEPRQVVVKSEKGDLNCCYPDSCLSEDGQCTSGMPESDLLCVGGDWNKCTEQLWCTNVTAYYCTPEGWDLWWPGMRLDCGSDGQGRCVNKECIYCNEELEGSLVSGQVANENLCTEYGFTECRVNVTHANSGSFLCNDQTWYECTGDNLATSEMIFREFVDDAPSYGVRAGLGSIYGKYACADGTNWKQCDDSRFEFSFKFFHGGSPGFAICDSGGSWKVCESSSYYSSNDTIFCGCSGSNQCVNMETKTSGLCMEEVCCTGWSTSDGGCHSTQKDACSSRSGMVCDTLSDGVFEPKGICAGDVCCISDLSGERTVVSTQAAYVGVEACVSTLREEHLGLFCDRDLDGEFDGRVGMIDGRIRCCSEDQGCSFGEEVAQEEVLPTYAPIPKSPVGDAVSVCGDCDDSDPCTDDYCEEGVCVHEEICNDCGDGFCAPGECSTCAEDCSPSQCRDGVCDTVSGEMCSDPDCICEFEYLTPEDRSFELRDAKQMSVFVKNNGNFREKFSISLEGDVSYNVEEESFYLDPGEEKDVKFSLLNEEPGAYLFEVNIKPEHGSAYTKSVLAVVKDVSEGGETFITSPAFRYAVVIFILVMGFGSALFYGAQLFGEKKVQDNFSPYQQQQIVRQQQYYTPQPQQPQTPKINEEELKRIMQAKSARLVKKE